MRIVFLIIIAICLDGSGFASDIINLNPDYKDVSYGPYSKNTLDIYLATSKQSSPVLIFFHGGAFSGGDKTKEIPVKLFKLCIDNGISVISVNYRLSTEKDYCFKYSRRTPVPPAFEDVARAVQFIGYNATKYNIDKNRLAVSGGSAGGGMALWLAFVDDMSCPDDKDPICRESTKPVCVVALYAQTTYDQEYIAENMNYDGYKIAWIDKLFQMNSKQLRDPKTKIMRKNVSPLDHVDAADKVRVFLCRGGEERVTPDMPQSKFVHNVIFYRELEKKLKACKISYELILDSEYASGKRKGNVDSDTLQFLKMVFHMN